MVTNVISSYLRFIDSRKLKKNSCQKFKGKIFAGNLVTHKNNCQKLVGLKDNKIPICQPISSNFLQAICYN